MKISFLIVNWNAGEYLKQCIESILNNCTLELEICIVDNNSTDNSMEAIESLAQSITIIKNNENAGFSRANNKGLRSIHTDYCVLLNPDTLISKGSIETLVAFMNEHPHAAIVAPRLINADSSIQESYGRFPSIPVETARFLSLNKAVRFLRNKFSTRADAVPLKVDWVFGACFLGRIEPIRSIGGFDETFFMYSEDLELCYRLRKHHWEIWFHPDAIITHYSSVSADKKWTSIEKYYAKYDGFYKFLYSTRGRVSTNMLTLIFILDLMKKFLQHYQSDPAYHAYYRNAVRYQLKQLNQ
jgi:GT2 family glycosyltransferase